MMCMRPAHGLWRDGFCLPAIKWFKFFRFPKAFAHEGLMIEQKYLTAAIAARNR
jgi:hypothetical protein